MTGKQLTKKLRAIRSNIPIILSTGYSDVVDEDEVKELGIYKYLLKPLKLTTLQETIEACLEEAE